MVLIVWQLLFRWKITPEHSQLPHFPATTIICALVSQCLISSTFWRHLIVIDWQICLIYSLETAMSATNTVLHVNSGDLQTCSLSYKWVVICACFTTLHVFSDLHLDGFYSLRVCIFPLNRPPTPSWEWFKGVETSCSHLCKRSEHNGFQMEDTWAQKSQS